MSDHVEILVIGSGFGGSIAAQRLSEGGRDVLLLERGPWRSTVPTRSMGIENLRPLPQGSKVFTHGLRSAGSFRCRREFVFNKNGFAELYFGDGVNVICSSNVGGGSHIYAGVLGRPTDPNYWDDRHPDLSQKGMEKYYDEMLALFGARPISPDDAVPNTISQTNYDGALSNAGLKNPAVGLLLPETPGAPQKITYQNGVERWECDMRNNSFLGSPSGAKTTLDFSVIWPAMQRGLAVRASCEVKSIHKLRTQNEEGMRYEVRYRNHRLGRDEVVLAKHVILAAGCLNTLRLLLRSRDIEHGLDGMPRLGLRFGTNGGFFGFWKENSDRDLGVGMPLCGPFRSRGSTNKIVQILRAGIQGLESVPLPGPIKRWLQRNSCIVGFGGDADSGSIYLRLGKFTIKYNKDDNEVYREMDSEIRSIEAATHTKIYALKAPVTVQPIGGACLGSSNSDGVVDANGEVFDNPGLYVVDASALPQSPGAPPSLTIAAWSAHVADGLLDTLQNHTGARYRAES